MKDSTRASASSRTDSESTIGTSGSTSKKTRPRPKLAVYKFASCDGCQLSLLSVEDKLVGLTERVEIAHFLEASSRILPGPYDIGLIEGSVTNNEDAHRIRQIRQDCKYLMTIEPVRRLGEFRL